MEVVLLLLLLRSKCCWEGWWWWWEWCKGGGGGWWENWWACGWWWSCCCWLWWVFEPPAANELLNTSAAVVWWLLVLYDAIHLLFGQVLYKGILLLRFRLNFTFFYQNILIFFFIVNFFVAIIWGVCCVWVCLFFVFVSLSVYECVFFVAGGGKDKTPFNKVVFFQLKHFSFIYFYDFFYNSPKFLVSFLQIFLRWHNSGHFACIFNKIYEPFYFSFLHKMMATAINGGRHSSRLDF